MLPNYRSDDEREDQVFREVELESMEYDSDNSQEQDVHNFDNQAAVEMRDYNSMSPMINKVNDEEYEGGSFRGHVSRNSYNGSQRNYSANSGSNSNRASSGGRYQASTGTMKQEGGGRNGRSHNDTASFRAGS